MSAPSVSGPGSVGDAIENTPGAGENTPDANKRTLVIVIIVGAVMLTLGIAFLVIMNLPIRVR